MKYSRSDAGVTVLEVTVALAVISLLVGIYLVMVDSYKDRRMSEQAAKVLMQAALVQEEYFAKEHRYFDAEIAGAGGSAVLTTPGGAKTQVHVPPSVTLSMKAHGQQKREFVGYAFYSGSKMIHRYDSKTGKITTGPRARDDTG
jgi:Tfp pilus assembly protein PilE